jgi:CBS domain-containing protein
LDRQRRNTMFVRERMSTPVQTIGANQSYHDALKLMQLEQLHHLPVVDGDGALIGLVAERDLLMAALQYTTQADVEVAEVMHVGAVTATPDMTIATAAERMLKERIGCLPVMDAAGTIVGMITETDMLRALVETLE